MPIASTYLGFFRTLLIDLQLLGELVADDEWPGVKEACLEVFDGHAKHSWSPEVTAYESWDAGCRALAEETGFSVGDIGEAAATVAQLIDRINAS